MNLIAISAYAVAGLAALSVATLALPRHVSVERVAVLEAAPEQIIALAASNAGFQRFNPYTSQDPDLKIDLFGPVSGVGSGFAFDGKDGTGRQTVAAVSVSEVVYNIDLGALGRPTQSIATVATDAGTEVTWRVDSDTGYNPVFRVFGVFMDRMMGPTFELGLENLAKATA